MEDKIPDSSSDEAVEETESDTTARDDHNLQQFSPPLEVLTHHQGGGVKDHANPNTNHQTIADEDLVPLTGK